MSKKLIITRGLPGSGKTTWARELQLQLSNLHIHVISKDDIRKAHTLTGWRWTPEGEKEILHLRDAAVRNLFKYDADIVICADTNFGKHETRLRDLAKQCGAEFEIKDFTDVPVETCIERDSKRPEDERVGPEVIKQMYNKYLVVEEPVTYVPEAGKPIAIICDLDGTIALHANKRSPYDYAKCEGDVLNESVAHIVKLYAASGYTILYVSGREAWCQPQTEKWLAKHDMPFGGRHKLLMRPSGDQRKDNIVKAELFNGNIRDHYDVRFVLDDRDQVVKMWRELGLTCLQVNYGAF